MPQDARRFEHFDHKGTLAGVQIVIGADTSVDAVSDANASIRRRYVGSSLGEDDDERGLAKIGGLAAPVSSVSPRSVREQRLKRTCLVP